MRGAAVPWPGAAGDYCDTCGTGGDGARTINVSTLAGIVLAAAGLPVAKHGNRAVSSTSGSADLLERLGVALDRPPEGVAESLERNGITFLFAQAWHPAMKYAGPVRKALGVRTVFNLLGPLTNPAPISYQTIGVFHKDFMERVAVALAGLGRKGAYVIHGADGLDEVSPETETHFIKIESGRVTDRGTVRPEDFGFARFALDEIRIDSPEEALERARAILDGSGRDADNAVVAMNAALVYSLARGTDLNAAAQECLAVIKSGKGAEVVRNWAGG
jgi:anthranilate phosphoribosyltransferase